MAISLCASSPLSPLDSNGSYGPVSHLPVFTASQAFSDAAYLLQRLDVNFVEQAPQSAGNPKLVSYSAIKKSKCEDRLVNSHGIHLLMHDLHMNKCTSTRPRSSARQCPRLRDRRVDSACSEAYIDVSSAAPPSYLRHYKRAALTLKDAEDAAYGFSLGELGRSRHGFSVSNFFDRCSAFGTTCLANAW